MASYVSFERCFTFALFYFLAHLLCTLFQLWQTFSNVASLLNFVNCGKLLQLWQTSSTSANFFNCGKLYQLWQTFSTLANFFNCGKLLQLRQTFFNCGKLFQLWQTFSTVANFFKFCSDCLKVSRNCTHPMEEGIPETKVNGIRYWSNFDK